LPLAVIGIAWGLQVLLIGSGSQGACRPLGANGIQWSAWLEHLAKWNHAFVGNAWTYAYLIKLLVAGLILGLVLALENHFFIKSMKSAYLVNVSGVTYLKEESLLRRNTGQNIFSSMLTGMPASMSTSRTRLLNQLNGEGRLAVWSHGIFLVLMLGIGQRVIAQFPPMAVCAALLLAGVLMIDHVMANTFWQFNLIRKLRVNSDLWIFVTCVLCGALLSNGNWAAMLIALLVKLISYKLIAKPSQIAIKN
jgi:hypothetical protein